MTSFNLLNDKVKKFITNDLKWNKLTDIQESVIPEVLQGKNIIALAPTAGGKTESVFFPVLNTIYDEKITGVTTLYISPIKALLNNQEIRLKKLSKAIYQDAFKWHGDVSKSQKVKFCKNPCSILMITPESLEVILLSDSYDKGDLFGNLRFIIIDEIHSFADSDRGYHLISIIERLQTYSKFDIQRLGLSATVGNPSIIGTWLKGSSKRKGIVINPLSNKKTDRNLNIFVYNQEEEFIENIYQSFGDKKTIFFVNGRRDAERIHTMLKSVMENTYVHHSSMDKTFRNLAEESFRLKSEPSCIICTSTMELGIDIGDLDSVLQLDSPSTVSSYLQRIGRSGRRANTKSEMTFYVSEKEKFILALAIKSLSNQGWVENITVSKRAYHIYFHQIISLIVQEAGIYQDNLFDLLHDVYCFSGIDKESYEKLINHLITMKILEKNSRTKLYLGLEGEKRFQFQHFKKLYSVFETVEEFSIKYKNKEIGTLQAWFVFSMGNNPTFYLSGNSWEVIDIDEKNKVIHVEKAEKASLPKWSGQPILLTYEICQEYIKIISGELEITNLNPKELNYLKGFQAQEIDSIQKSGEIIIKETERKTLIFTFCGNKVNYTIALMLKYYLKFETFEVNGYQIVIHKEIKSSEILEYIEKFKKNPKYYFSETFIERISRFFPKIEYSKFQSYLPEELSNEYLSDLILDPEKTEYVINNFKFK
ncbi:MAG: DEAD/DEAH box helicase [Candidatus Sericytochromatia bacterium]